MLVACDIFIRGNKKTFWWRLGHHSSKLQGQRCMANSCACLCCTQPIRLVQGHAASGQGVKYSNTNMRPRGGRHTHTNHHVHVWQAALVHIHHGMIFYFMSNGRLNTRGGSLVCEMDCVDCMLCVLLSSAFHKKKWDFLSRAQQSLSLRHMSCQHSFIDLELRPSLKFIGCSVLLMLKDKPC